SGLLGGPSQPPDDCHALWVVEIDPGGPSVCSAKLSPLSPALPTRGGRALGAATRRVWPGGDCADWEVSLSRTSQCAGDAPGTSGTWDQHCAAQRDLFDAAL